MSTCQQVKPIVSKYLTDKELPYQEDRYLSRLKLFFHKYQELMVFAPPITELVGVQWKREDDDEKVMKENATVEKHNFSVFKCISVGI